MRVVCVSSDHSGWSNNAHMWTRRWFIDSTMLGCVRDSTKEGSGFWELNAMGWCRSTYVRESGRKPQVCQLFPGIFNHHEVDGRRRLLRAGEAPGAPQLWAGQGLNATR
jgi:hypothetical protein